MATATYPLFVGPGGTDPVQHIRSFETAVMPTVGDCVYAGQLLRARIRQRTAEGVDVDGMPFAAYSEPYRKRKIARLGHADTVDLFGFAQHPHMLNTMIVRCGSTELPANQPAEADPFALDIPATLFQLGYYGEEAVRARVHNEGAEVRTAFGTGKGKPKPGGRSTFTMPRRHHFDANGDDVDLMGFAIRDRMLQRALRLALRLKR
ncbi:MAG: hypothetical protein NVS1B6_00890 [Steroidobacteraceae bacterium]